MPNELMAHNAQYIYGKQGEILSSVINTSLPECHQHQSKHFLLLYFVKLNILANIFHDVARTGSVRS